jgi:hypothetical protein
MFYYHTDAQRQMLREHAEQLAREMRRYPDPTTPRSDRDHRTPWFTNVLRSARWVRWAQLRAHTYHG